MISLREFLGTSVGAGMKAQQQAPGNSSRRKPSHLQILVQLHS